MTSGSNDGITKDQCYKSTGPLNVDNAVRDLNAAGVSWRAYMESLPSPGSTVCQSPDGAYAVRHNPFMFYSDVQGNTAEQQHIVPSSQLHLTQARALLLDTISSCRMSATTCMRIHAVPTAARIPRVVLATGRQTTGYQQILDLYSSPQSFNAAAMVC